MDLFTRITKSKCSETPAKTVFIYLYSLCLDTIHSLLLFTVRPYLVQPFEPVSDDAIIFFLKKKKIFVKQPWPHKASMAHLHFTGSLKEVNAHVHLKVHVIEDVRLSWKKRKKSSMLLRGCEIAALQLSYMSLCHSRRSNSDPTLEICPRQQNRVKIDLNLFRSIHYRQTPIKV